MLAVQQTAALSVGQSSLWQWGLTCSTLPTMSLHPGNCAQHRLKIQSHFWHVDEATVTVQTSGHMVPFLRTNGVENARCFRDVSDGGKATHIVGYSSDSMPRTRLATDLTATIGKRPAAGGRRLGDRQFLTSLHLLSPVVPQQTSSHTRRRLRCHTLQCHAASICFPTFSGLHLPATPLTGVCYDNGNKGPGAHITPLPHLQSCRAVSHADSASLGLQPPFHIDENDDAPIFKIARQLHLELRQKVESETGVLFQEDKAPLELRDINIPETLTKGSLVLRNGDKERVHAMVEGAMRMKPNGKAAGNAYFALYMGPSTDVPHFMFELFVSEMSVLFLIDLFPRRDLVLHVDYLDEVYAASGMQEISKRCEQDERMKKYYGTDLYSCHALSPTYLAYTIPLTKGPVNEEEEELERVEVVSKTVTEVVRPLAFEVFDIWSSLRQSRENNVTSQSDRKALIKRDFVQRAESIKREEGLERAFGTVVASKMRDAIRSV